MGFDEIRVRYRQQRRALIRQIIIENLQGQVLENTLHIYTVEKIPEIDRGKFREDVLQDLEELSAHRITGIGVTIEQLQHWLQLRR